MQIRHWYSFELSNDFMTRTLEYIKAFCYYMTEMHAHLRRYALSTVLLIWVAEMRGSPMQTTPYNDTYTKKMNISASGNRSSAKYHDNRYDHSLVVSSISSRLSVLGTAWYSWVFFLLCSILPARWRTVCLMGRLNCALFPRASSYGSSDISAIGRIDWLIPCLEPWTLIC